MTLAALAATLRLYSGPEQAKERIPTLASLWASPQDLRRRAEELLELLGQRGLKGTVVPHQRPVGGGSAPGQLLDGWAVSLSLPVRPEKFARRLRMGKPPVVARVHQGKLLLDPAALLPGELPLLAQACEAASKEAEEESHL